MRCRREHPALPVFRGNDDDTRKLSAAWLIDSCGWKGHRDGDAGVAASHALVLVNHGHATGAQLLDLARRIADSVQRTLRRRAGTRTAHHRRDVVSAPPHHAHPHPRAALLMLGSTVFFGLMAVAIRLASETLHTFEIAFFRNFFGLVAALPLLLRHGPGLLRTTQLPRYFLRCVIGVRVDALRLLGDRPPAAGAGDLAVVFDAAVRHHRRGVCARRARARAPLGRGDRRLHRRAGDRAPGQRRLHRRHAGRGARRRCSAASSRSRSSSCRAPNLPTASCSTPTLLWVPLSLVPALFVWEWPQGITWLWVVAAGVLGTGGHMLWTRALQAGRRLRADADQLHAAAAGRGARLVAVRRSARPLDRARRRRSSSAPTPTSPIARRNWRAARRPTRADRGRQAGRMTQRGLLGDVVPRLPRPQRAVEHQPYTPTAQTSAAAQPARMSDG